MARLLTISFAPGTCGAIGMITTTTGFCAKNTFSPTLMAARISHFSPASPLTAQGHPSFVFAPGAISSL
jgi:hypothetical protein